MNLVGAVRKKFIQLFREDPLLVRSPGRVNLLGEHTDYNMGFVLPAAIDKAMYFAVTPRSDSQCEAFALDVNQSCRFTIDNLWSSRQRWPNYLMGVVDQFTRGGLPIKGFNCVFGGDIPIGAGMSSSAALETGLAFALNALYCLGLDKLSLVKLAQRAENEFVGVRCGIMDQYVNMFGERNNVLRIDCRSLESSCFPFTHDVSLVLFDTRVSHSLASTEYNRRREECGEGVDILRRAYPAVTHLRDVSPDMLERCKHEFPGVIYRRCSYVIEENERVLRACQALEREDIQAFGLLMRETHEGLRRDYEVSCEELDYLVELTRDNPCVYGSRLMGGGFGGCTINLIRKDAIRHVSETVALGYAGKFGVEPKIYVTSINSGTSTISVDEHATA